ncbi:MAG: rhodanese-like domain-containing protein [Spirosomaceae bacterium]|nr:rhodanese-like domain-containing protein [Spirosomataceae bacterium]
MKSLLKFTSVLLFTLIVGSASAQVNLGVDDFVKKYKATPNSQLLDVRTPAEWANGKLNNSICTDYLDESFAKKVEQLDKKKPVFVFCAVGGRSAKATKALKDAGFTQIYNLKEAGYNQLKAKGL